MKHFAAYLIERSPHFEGGYSISIHPGSGYVSNNESLTNQEYLWQAVRQAPGQSSCHSVFTEELGIAHFGAWTQLFAETKPVIGDEAGLLRVSENRDLDPCSTIEASKQFPPKLELFRL